MRNKLILSALLVLSAGGAILYLVLSGSETEKAPPGSEATPEDEFNPRRSSDELSRKISQLKKARKGLPSELAAEAAKSEEAREYWRRTRELQKDSPEEALAEAREKLSQLEDKIASESDPDENAKLERQREMVKKILGRLEKMAEKKAIE